MNEFLALAVLVVLAVSVTGLLIAGVAHFAVEADRLHGRGDALRARLRRDPLRGTPGRTGKRRMTTSHTHEEPAVTRVRRRSLVAQLSVPARQFLSTEAGSAGLLLGATVLALVWANSPWSGSYEALWTSEVGVSVAGWELSMDLAHWVNDGLMALFFFVIGLEVRREFSVGALTTPRRAAIPVIAAVGGLVVPAALYLALAPGGEAARAWGVVIGTDTAFLLGALAVVVRQIHAWMDGQ